MQRPKLVLIDGHSILNRAFYGMPDLTNAQGAHTGAVYGFLSIMFKILEEEKADYLTVAFDVHAPTFRHVAYEAYKGTRKGMPEELREQVPLMKKVLTAMGIQIREQAGLEADDILGTLAVKAESEGMDVALVSGDRDLLQIASEHICVRVPKTIKGQTVIENYHTEDVLAKYQVTPKQFIDVKALMGDSSDNVPGVPKVGEKTATQLIVEYGSVGGVYEHIDEIKKPALKRNLSENEELAKLSLFLVTIKTDCEIEINWEKAQIGNFYTKEAFALFTELEFRKYLSRFDSAQAVEDERAFSYAIVEDSEFASSLFKRITEQMAKASKDAPYTVAAYPVHDANRYGEANESELLGLCLSFYGEESGEAENYFLKTNMFLPQEDLTRGLGEIRRTARDLAEKEDGSERARVAVFDVKKQYPFWEIDANAEFAGEIHLEGMMDLLLMCYLINPLQSDYQPEMIASEYISRTLPVYKQVFDKKTRMQALEADEEAFAQYFCKISQVLLDAMAPVYERLEKEEMWDLYRQIERPLTYVLYDMERIGIRIQPQALATYSEELGDKAEELTQKIYAETGEEFNIASPKQLGTVLFEHMGLPGGKKTKTGYSTAAGVLEKLAPEYPVVNDILEYRGITKLKSTYADGLMAFVASDGRIHTSFNQTITATGRISSTEPNLQNIPMKTEMGKRIRKAFIPSDGDSFVDADYSQIELRILAHMSADSALVEAYRENEDIHAITASKVFHVPFEEVTAIQRRNAKAVNFGIVYGISSFGLSQGLSISRKEAAEYIEAYFDTYPGIKEFLDRLVKDGKENGYVATMYGRRRPVPELASSNFMQRQFGERVAMNSPIQGSAADIMKIAMIRVWERLLREHRASRLILQIHDELLIEAAPGEEKIVQMILKEEMKNAANLLVTLETDVHSGSDWYMAK